MSLIRSVSGVRGIVGDSLTAALAARYAFAFARLVGAGTVAVGRDSRPSGPRLLDAVTAGLTAAGARPFDAGLCATPAVQVAVEDLHADGGIVLTASHNPAPWNGLKFIGADGAFLGPERVRELFTAADAVEGEALSEVTSMRANTDAVSGHVRRSLAAPETRPERIAAARLTVVVDGCRSVGGLSTVKALREAGCTVIELDCQPDGRFTRGLEPLPENLGALGETVREHGADFGVAHDPDGDRAALVDERGEPLGEEMTLAIAVDAVLRDRRGPVVVNLSTSRLAEDLAAAAGVPFARAPVGEIHVVEAMRALGAVVGGEGNGGVILPSAHMGRDGTVAALLVARWRAEANAPLSSARERLPAWTMRKEKIEGVAWSERRASLLARFEGAAVDERDGLRFAWPDAWLHVRPSGTEPIVRVIAEARRLERLDELCGAARAALGAESGAGAAPEARSGPYS